MRLLLVSAAGPGYTGYTGSYTGSYTGRLYRLYRQLYRLYRQLYRLYRLYRHMYNSDHSGKKTSYTGYTARALLQLQYSLVSMIRTLV